MTVKRENSENVQRIEDPIEKMTAEDKAEAWEEYNREKTHQPPNHPTLLVPELNLIQNQMLGKYLHQFLKSFMYIFSDKKIILNFLTLFV